MGSTYGNVTLPRVEATEVVEALGDRPALVHRSGGGVVVFTPVGEASAVADLLSEALGAVALAVEVYDEDVLVLSMHERGHQVDAYQSVADLLEGGGPVGGDPERLVATLGGDLDAVTAALAGARVFETDRHRELVGALRLPDEAVSWGYEYLDRPPGDDLPRWAGSLLRSPSEKRQRRGRRG